VLDYQMLDSQSFTAFELFNFSCALQITVNSMFKAGENHASNCIVF